MAKFELLCARDNVAVIKIGNSPYYIDYDDKHEIKVFDAELKRQNIIVPEFWLPEVTKGEATLAVVIASATAYQNGYNDGYRTRGKIHYREFVERLFKALMDPRRAEHFLSIFWVELKPFENIKKLVSQIVGNRTIREKRPAVSRNTLERYQVRAEHEGDREHSDRIHAILSEMDEASFDARQQLFDVLRFDDVPRHSFEIQIQKVVGLRPSG